HLKVRGTLLTDYDWSWSHTLSPQGESLHAPEGDRFVLSFDPLQQSVSSLTDCNTLFGEYMREGKRGLTFGPLASTMMYCEGSLEQAYGIDLAKVERFRVDKKFLVFVLNDGGKMI